MSVSCKHWGKLVSYDILSRMWKDSSLVFPQYCPTSAGGELHEPTKAQIVIDCEKWAASSDVKFVVPDDMSTAFWLECQLWVTMSMRDHFWLKEKMQAHHPEVGKYHPTHEEQVTAAMEAEFDVCMSGHGMLQLRRSK